MPNAAVITIGDRVHAEVYEDVSGPTRVAILEEMGGRVVARHTGPANRTRSAFCCAGWRADQGSGILISMVKAHGLAIIPEDADYLPAGSLVKVMMLDWPER